MEFFLIMIAPLLIIAAALALMFLWGARGKT